MFCAVVSFAGEIPFEAEVLITAEELSAIAGGDEIEAQVLAVDTDGNLVVFCDAHGMVGGALLEIDVTRHPVIGSVIIPELGLGSLDEGQRGPKKEPMGDINFVNIVVSSDGTIWGGEFEGDDEILAIRRGSTVRVESVLQTPGITGIGLGRDEKGNEALWWIEEKAWQHQDSIQEGRGSGEGVLIYPLPSGPPSVLVLPDFIKTGTNNPKGPGLETLAVAPDGSFALAMDIKF